MVLPDNQKNLIYCLPLASPIGLMATRVSVMPVPNRIVMIRPDETEPDKAYIVKLLLNYKAISMKEAVETWLLI